MLRTRITWALFGFALGLGMLALQAWATTGTRTSAPSLLERFGNQPVDESTEAAPAPAPYEIEDTEAALPAPDARDEDASDTLRWNLENEDRLSSLKDRLWAELEQAWNAAWDRVLSEQTAEGQDDRTTTTTTRRTRVEEFRSPGFWCDTDWAPSAEYRRDGRRVREYRYIVITPEPYGESGSRWNERYDCW